MRAAVHIQQSGPVVNRARCQCLRYQPLTKLTCEARLLNHDAPE